MFSGCTVWILLIDLLLEAHFAPALENTLLKHIIEILLVDLFVEWDFLGPRSQEVYV